MGHIPGDPVLDGQAGILLKETTTPVQRAGHCHVYSKDTGLLYFECGGTEHTVVLAPTPCCGTFTPTVTLVGGAGNTVPIYTTNAGRYVKYSTVVYVDVVLSGDGGAEGAGTGQVNIALPVTAGASLNGNGVGVVGIATNNSENHILHGSIAQGATTITLQRWSSIKVLTNLVGNDQDTTDRLINLHFWYEID